MLNARLKAQIRRTVNKHLTQECRIERQQFDLVDDYGGDVVGPWAEVNGVCLLTRVNRTGMELLAGSADVGRVYYMLQLPFDADIRDADEVVIDEERYRVEQVMRSQGVDVMRQALVVKIGG